MKRGIISVFLFTLLAFVRTESYAENTPNLLLNALQALIAHPEFGSIGL